MTIEILSIGNELLSGHTINTNAATIGQTLLSHGYSISRVTFLPDEPDALKKGIEEAMERASFVITTGGLGPTGDDLTRDIVSEIYGMPLVRDAAIADDLIQRFGKNLPTLEDQAMVLKGSTVIPNPLGTAPGFICEGKATLFVLPGVPSQMEVMLSTVASYLYRKHLKKHTIETLYLCLLPEQDVDPYLRILEKEHPGVEIGICPSYGVLSIYLHADDPALLPPVRKKIGEKFKTHFYAAEEKEIGRAVHQWMVDHHKTLAAGESCTGGHLAAALTKHAGASDYFLGSIVSYSNHLKEAALSVSPNTLKTHGAVSKETVTEMARGVQKLTGADYALATSGIAGPKGGTPDKPVGTVWTAIATPDTVFTGLIPTKPSAKNRHLVIRYTTTYLLGTLWRLLAHNIEPFR